MEIPRPQFNENLSDQLGCRVDVIDCSALPTGTHKILKAERAFTAVADDPRTPIMISSGNYARAAQAVAEKLRRRVIIAMGADGAQLGILGSEFVEIVDIADLIAASDHRELLHPNLSLAYNIYTGRRPVDNTTVNITNLADIEDAEGFKRQRPTYGGIHTIGYGMVFCPNGSGELFYDLVSGHGATGTTQFYGISPPLHPAVTGTENFDQHPTHADKLATPVYPILDSHFSDLINSRDGRHIHFSEITEDEILATHAIAQAASLNAEPSASVGLACLVNSFRDRLGIVIKGSEKVLMVLTGNGDPAPYYSSDLSR